jgi:hypothetical protein
MAHSAPPILRDGQCVLSGQLDLAVGLGDYVVDPQTLIRATKIGVAAGRLCRYGVQLPLATEDVRAKLSLVSTPASFQKR